MCDLHSTITLGLFGTKVESMVLSRLTQTAWHLVIAVHPICHASASSFLRSQFKRTADVGIADRSVSLKVAHDVDQFLASTRL